MATIKTSEGVISYEPQIVYLGIKQMDKQIAFENLKVVAQIMNKSGLKWGPVYGSLLGIIRENDFITWDEDIDLFVLEEDKEKFLPFLFDFKKEGFDIIRHWRCGLLSIQRNGEYIDFYFPKVIANGIRCITGDSFLFEKYLVDTVRWNFKGLEFDIPKDYEEFLEFEYGDWRTPVQYANYDMTSIQKIKSISRLFIINHLPDFLYYPFFRKHHMKDLDKFKAKCAKKGLSLPEGLSLNSYR